MRSPEGYQVLSSTFVSGEKSRTGQTLSCRFWWDILNSAADLIGFESTGV